MILKNKFSLIIFFLCLLNISLPSFAFIKHYPINHLTFNDKFEHYNLKANLITVDLNNPKIDLDVALAYNNTNRRELVSEIAERNGAIAAINGSFFHSRNSISSAVGLIISEGRVLADSGHRRTSLGITDDNKVIIGIPKVSNYIQMPRIGVTLPINGINQVRQEKQIMIYTTHFGTNTKTNTPGREILINRYGKVIDFKQMNSPIPKGGFVISISGAGSEVGHLYPKGTLAYIDSKKFGRWKNVTELITGSPRLLRKGKVYNTYFMEKLQNDLKLPTTRTAVGITHNNKLLLLTVRGRLTLTRLAQIMLRLGATDALALDGGSSTSMYIDGKTLISNRKVTNALIVKFD